ncbi:MAG: NF038122 family metalloprotease [Caulobacterales bacterium]
MQINITYDASVANAPAGFKTAVQAAVQYFETTFSTPITVNITFGWGTVGGQPMDPGAVGESGSTYSGFSYSAIRAALAQDGTSSYAQLAAHFLPAADPTNGGTFELTSADAKALGLADPNGASLDGSVGLDATSAFNFDPSVRAVSGEYDAIGVLAHEISEVLGRQSGLGFAPPGGSPEFGLLDLFRYSAAGQLNPTSPTGSFSLDGQTLLMAFNDPTTGGDSGDWSSLALGDAFDAFVNQGTVQQVSPIDLAVMDVLGYHPVWRPPSTLLPNITPVGPDVVTQDTVVAQGQSVYFNSDHGFFIGGSATSAFTNSGAIVDVGAVNADPLTVSLDGGFFPGAVITNTASGVVYSEAVSGNAWGYDSGSGGPNLVNQGLLQVVSLAGDAWGVETNLGFQFTNTSSGTLTVWAQKVAVGLDMSSGNSGGSFTNAGDIEVTGASAIGVIGATTFDNSGTIHAVSANPSSPSIGVEVYEENASLYTNSGVITGDYAFDAEGFFGNPTQTAINLVNTGKMFGTIALANSPSQIHNTGDIAGDIRFGAANSVYDGAGGHLTGDIFLGHAVNTVTLGSDTGVVYGGGGSDTISGGAGNDFFEIGRGVSTIDGGGGFNTLSFADADMGVTVDLGAGTAFAAGADTIKNIQEVIGSGFNDTLKAGASAATLIAGTGYDTLIGGAGNDTLVAGAGGDAVTGGGGNNAFIYSAGDHQLMITDFNAGGDHDSLKIYGYAGASSVAQQGADTLITLSATDSILLKNVHASSLTGGGLVYSASAYQAPAVPPTLPIFGSTPIEFNYDLTVYAGEIINETAQAYGLLDEQIIGGFAYSSLDNSGAIHVTASNGDVYGIEDAIGAGGGVFTNESGATFSVSNQSGTAEGLYAVEDGMSLVNAGTFSVSASGDAAGIYTFGATGLALTNSASGVLSVSSSGGAAFGLRLFNGGDVENDGKIVVSAIGAATGYFGGRFEFETFVNNGTIQATSTGGGKSLGLWVAGSDLGPGHASITNTGAITAQTAILDEGPSAAIINSGTINGDIDLSGSASSLVNTGVIVGDIRLHDDESFTAAGDTVDLRGGTFTGFIAIAPGLHGDGPVHDTLYSSPGSTLIKIAGGESQLTVTVNGSKTGQTTVQFDIASTAASETRNANGSWTVNAGTDGTETLTNVQSLQFTDKTVTLAVLAPPAPHDLLGHGKSDFLIENTVGAVVVGEVSSGQAGYAQVAGLGSEWSFQGTGDFLGAGHGQFLVENTAGAVVVGDVHTGQASYTQVAALGPEWSFVGAGDFLGDGKSDFLIQNTQGAVVVGEVVSGQASYTQVAGLGSEWKFVGTGDFVGDGKADFLIENTAGAVVVGEVANGQAGYTQVAALGSEWKFVGTGDFLGDGKSDFLIENTAGAIVVGEVANGQASYTQVAALGPEWKFVGTGDYLGEGHDQFLIENTGGAIVVGDWLSSQIHYTQVSGLGSEWHFHG